MRQLHIHSLPSKKEAVWIDRTEILYHAIFQIFEDFILGEYSNKNFNLDPWPIPQMPVEVDTQEWHDYNYAIEDNAWKEKCKEILSFWSEMKKHKCCWSRAHDELKHKIDGIHLELDDWLEPPLPNGDRIVKECKEPKVYWDTLREMGELEECYENKINEYCQEIIKHRRWLWT